MSLAVGTRLASYEVTGVLGMGGMGEVYRARDTKLGRDVALKVVAESFAQDPERVARFHREAQLLAALNHPHIATIYGLEEVAGLQFLTMELVEGETLAERLSHVGRVPPSDGEGARGGPAGLPIDEALSIARHVADALQAAHEKGIIHRDLKPANIALTREGRVKVLDFGLAKSLEPIEAGSADANVTRSPTLSLAATQAGVILGTAAYMAPEQARGKPADKRVDIWAFGCVLYEMLTGRRAFEGEDASETLAFVMAREPDWSLLPGDLPPAIRALLQRCLERDRRKRVADISTAQFVLGDDGGLPGSSGSAAGAGSAGPSYADPTYIQTQIDAAVAVARRSMRRRMAVAGGSASIAAGLVAAASTWFLVHPAPARVERFTVTGSGPSALTIGPAERSLTVTPDGTRIVYAGNGGMQLLVRALDQLEARTIATGAVRGPFLAPDGQSVGFVDDLRVLKRVAIEGGPAVTIATMDEISRGAVWTEDDAIVFGTASTDTGLQRVSVRGGDVTVLTRPDRARGEADHVWPEALPGGRAVLFTIVTAGGPDASEVAVLDLNTGTHRTLLPGASHAQYVPTGHLVYTAGATLRAIAFDLRQLETRGTPVPVLPRLVTTVGGAGNYAFAADGTLAYADGPSVAGGGVVRTLVWVDRQGTEQPLSAPPRAYDDISLSPDGGQILAQIVGEQVGGGGVWVYDIARGTLTRRVFEATVTMPGWSADGKQIFFAAQRDRFEGLFSMPADGSGPQEPLVTIDAAVGASVASSDGRTLAFENRTEGDIWVVSLQGERTPRPLFETPFAESAPRLSPDGRWLAYQSNESGRSEVYLRPFPGPGGKWLISTEGGVEPTWSRTGRELFYRDGDKMMAVDIRTEQSFTASSPRILFEKPGYARLSRQYDVAPDGQRFLMLKIPDDVAAAQPHIVVVKNWFEELKRLVPTN